MLPLALLLGTTTAFALFVDAGQLFSTLAGCDLRFLLLALGWSAGNFALRGLRFAAYARRAQISIPHRHAVLVFLAGMSMAATPGKVGEVVKSCLLYDRHRVPVRQSLPVIVLERVNDLLSLLLLLGLGAWFTPSLRAAAGVCVALAAALGAVVVTFPHLPLSSRARWLPLPERLRTALHDAQSSSSRLSSAPFVAATTLLGCAAWACQVLALVAIVNGYQTSIGLPAASLVYSAPLLGGVLSLLPGGLGVAEAGMTQLLSWTVFGRDGAATAAACAMLVRLVTFWFAIGVGLVAWGMLELNLRRWRRGEASESA